MHRQRTLWERIKKYLEMPQLKRRDRNQRVAIVGVMIGLVVYLFVLRPLFDVMFPRTSPKQTQASPPPSSSKPGLGKKR